MRFVASIVFAAVVASSCQAGPLRLDYAVTDLGSGSYNYEFKLVLDNHDNSWVVGQGWNWIVFGDSASSSPLTNFQGDTNDLPIGPFISYTSSGGDHNGPTLIKSPTVFHSNAWSPSSVGDYLRWSGTSTAALPQGSLLFSTLRMNNGAVGHSFDVATQVSSVDDAAVPEPASWTLVVVVFGLLSVARRPSLRGKRREKETSASGDILG